MMPSVQQNHRRFVHQVQWTNQVRNYLLEKALLEPGTRLLEVGCGTGAVLEMLPGDTLKFGLDINLEFLAHAAILCPQVPLTGGDAHHLPIASDSFDVVCCHFLLLWVAEPAVVMAEMTRVCKPGGIVLVMAEPDYGGRIDHPSELGALGLAQTESLREQGADPLVGRKLPEILNSAGLVNLEVGIINNQWQPPVDPDEVENEWETLRSDLQGRLSTEALEHYFESDRKAWEDGSRVLYVPTFYAYGEVK